MLLPVTAVMSAAQRRNCKALGTAVAGWRSIEGVSAKEGLGLAHPLKSKS
jgi:hypothetical protein